MTCGFMDAKELEKWTGKDLKQIRKCIWMKDEEVKTYSNIIQQYREYKWWHEKLLECLPSKERDKYLKSINRISLIFQMKFWGNAIRRARLCIVQSLLAHDYQKGLLLEEEVVKKIYIPDDSQPQLSREEIATEKYKLQELTQMYPEGSNLDKYQREQKIQGYVPTKQVLDKIPPMEVIEYCGYKLIKYDQWHGYYAIMLLGNSYGHQIFYDEDAHNVEVLAEQEFDKLTTQFVENSNNSYGNKSYEEIDISNVTENMSNDSSPEMDVLNQTDIF